jgi:ribosomal protein L35AE/L33A
MKEWKAAEGRYAQARDWAERTFADDPHERSARLKGAAMRWAAEKRQITGELTGKEKQAAAQREASNYIGKSITFKGQQGTVSGHSFGKVRIKLADGSIISANPEDVK